jgi:curved DNA binding protein
MADVEEKVEDPSCEHPDVVTKYKIAGEMAGRVAAKVQAACVAGAKVFDLCVLGDAAILEEVGTVYNKKDAETGVKPVKGVGFPTCISINHCICHNSPIASDADIIVEAGDLVKIDLGVHIDGYIAPCATTFIVGGGEITGRKADALMAAYQASEVALRMMRPGASTYDITDAVGKIAETYNCKAVEGMLSHQLFRNKIDGEKAIILSPTPQLKKEHKKAVIAENEAYGLDIIISTGDGKGKEGEQRTTVFKKTEAIYNLKMKASRAFYSEISKNNKCMPFTLRQMVDEKNARLGVQECVKHEVVDAFKILWENDGEFVAQFKLLVLVLPKGNLRASAVPFDPATVKSEFKLEDETMVNLLKTQVGTKNKKKKNKKKAAAPAAAADGADK